MLHRITFAATAAVLLVAVSLPAEASLCGRHFYNNSNYPWTMTLSGPNRCDNGSGSSHTCTVKPHSTMAILYNPVAPMNPIIIKSRVYNGDFVVTPDCKIQHRGRTGNAFMNDPANGDVSTCSGNC